jgi:hypothetical protein
MTSPAMTQMGFIVGTAAYMAPEQAKGRPVDRRADVWAFGVVLYEILTGRRLFEAEDISETLAAVLTRDLSLTSLSDGIPPRLRALVRDCLVRDPRQRLRDMGEARRVLERVIAGASDDAVAAPAAPTPVKRPLWRLALPWLAGAIGMTGVWLASRPAAVTPAPAVRTVITLPDGLSVIRRDRGLALSPDGTQLALVLIDQRPRSQLYVRDLSKLELRALAGTDGATYPFWSPDGRSVGFFAEEQLKRVDLADGVIRAIAPALQARGGTWGPGDVAVFSAADNAAAVRGRLYRISMSAPGAATPIGPNPTDAVVARLPTFLSSGVLYELYDRLVPERSTLQYLDLATGQSREIAASSGEAHYVESGWLASVTDAMVTVRQFDARGPSVSGTPFVVAPAVASDVLRGTGHISLARNAGHTLVYLQAAPISEKQLTFMSADGQAGAPIGEAAPFTEVALAPDGRRAVVAIANQAGAFRPQLWMVDLASGLRAPFTGPQDGGSNMIWSPDGTRVAYTGSDGRLVVRRADGSGAPVVIGDPTQNHTPYGWTRDGTQVVVGNYRGLRGIDLALMAADGREARILFESEAAEAGGKISPDGRWLAYISTETGRQELYVTAFPVAGPRWPVTRNGVFGAGPDALAWTPEGDGLQYLGLDGRLTRIALSLRDGVAKAGDTRPLLGGRDLTGSIGWIEPVGGRYLIALPLPGQQLRQSIVLVTNWQSELRK